MNAITLRNMTASKEELESEFGKVPVGYDGFTDDQGYLLDNFVLLHGTDCVWDIAYGRVMKISHLKISAPISFKKWQESPGRKWINSDDLVFDPEGKHVGDHINMFSGIKMVPVSGDAMPIINHLYKLCGGDDAVVDWIIKWIAYPLQNVGAKMATAVVFHGAEGTGKNIFWDLVCEIYGRWSVQISQSQIETEFNAWILQKLFVLANEVLSNRERKHIKGRLKALITEKSVLINQKNMPIREESNHANFVFLSNESQPIDTDTSDRRLMVVECSEVSTGEYYKELKSKIDVEAFYQFLLNYDLEGFNVHTKPIVTDAKLELIKQNMRSEQLFIQQWIDGDIDGVPYETIMGSILYDAYRCWCYEQGERFPCTNTKFGRAINDARIDKQRVCFENPQTGRADANLRRFVVIVSPLEAVPRLNHWDQIEMHLKSKQISYGMIRT